MKYGDKVVHIHWGGVASLYVRLLEAEFPSYREVLPATHKHRFVIDRDVVGEALKRVKLAARDSAKAVRFSFGGDSLVLSANQHDVMSAQDEVPCDADSPLSIGLNAAFIGDALAACPEGDIVVKSGGALAPLVLEPRGDASAFYVVMPVRLD
jgi:DNA polymerase-3 subunit beta